MNWWIVLIVAAVVAILIVAVRLGWIDLSNKTSNSSSSGSSIVNIGDEVFAPTRHEAQLELDRQTVLPAPAPVAGDGDKGIFDGTIKINVGTDSDAPTRSARHLASD